MGIRLVRCARTFIAGAVAIGLLAMSPGVLRAESKLDLGARVKNFDLNLPFPDLSSVRGVPEVYFRVPNGRFAFEMSFTNFSTSYEESRAFQALVVKFTPQGALLVSQATQYDLKETLTVTPIVGSLQCDVIRKGGFRGYIGGGLGFYSVRFQKTFAMPDVPVSLNASGNEVILAQHGEIGLAWNLFERVAIVGNARQSFAQSSRGFTFVKDFDAAEPVTGGIGDLGSLSYGIGITVRL